MLLIGATSGLIEERMQRLRCSIKTFEMHQLFVGFLSIAMLMVVTCARSVSAQRHLILFGVDGLSVEGVADAKTPNIHALMKSGAWTFQMHSVRPTISAPNWASMIMGAPLELNSVTSNHWTTKNYPYPPACQSTSGMFPTVLGFEHQQHPNAKIGFFTDWDTYAHLFEPGVATRVVEHGSTDEVFSQALAYLGSDKPEVLVIHIDIVDHAGHGSGWGSPAYLAAVEKMDAMLGQLIETLDKLNLRKSTTVMFVVDHGGKGRAHGGDSAEEIEIPWVISGPGVKRNYELKGSTLMQYDTAATMAHILNVKPSPCWRGQAIDEAFAKTH